MNNKSPRLLKLSENDRIYEYEDGSLLIVFDPPRRQREEEEIETAGD
jgi:hypothetical protein